MDAGWEWVVVAARRLTRVNAKTDQNRTTRHLPQRLPCHSPYESLGPLGLEMEQRGHDFVG